MLKTKMSLLRSNSNLIITSQVSSSFKRSIFTASNFCSLKSQPSNSSNSKTKSAELSKSNSNNSSLRDAKSSTLKDIFAQAMSLPKEMNQNPLFPKDEASEWKTIYRFSHIRSARVIQRLKLYQTAFTGFFAVPTSLGCYLYGAVGPEVIVATTVGCALACEFANIFMYSCK
jgi:hypothetical protein